MIAGIESALSGLRAFTTKIEKNANNIANMNTDGFKGDRVLLSSQSPQGVKATVVQGDTSGPMVPASIDGAGAMTEQSNVDLVEELTDMIANTHGFSANLKTLQATDQMTKSVLDIKA